MDMPQDHIIESLEKVTGYIGKTTYRIAGFRKHQFSKTLTILVILLRNRKMRHQNMGLVGIKNFFHILENVGQGITNPLNFLILIVFIVNTGINRINKGKEENLAVLKLDGHESLLQTCAQMKALRLKKVSPKMQTFSPIVIATDSINRNLLL